MSRQPLTLEWVIRRNRWSYMNERCQKGVNMFQNEGLRVTEILLAARLWGTVVLLTGCLGGETSYGRPYEYDPRYDNPRYDPTYRRPVYRYYSPWGTREPYGGPPTWYEDPTW